MEFYPLSPCIDSGYSMAGEQIDEEARRLSLHRYLYCPVYNSYKRDCISLTDRRLMANELQLRLILPCVWRTFILIAILSHLRGCMAILDNLGVHNSTA